MTDDDRDAFRKAMQGVRRLKHERHAERTQKPTARARMSRAARAALIEASWNGSLQDFNGEEIAFRRDGVNERTFRSLCEGRFSLEAELDLHGMNALQAEIALKEFITESAARGLGCVRIIHGKGARSGPEGPVLKQLVQHHLPRWNPVLAFVTARPRHGGHGACYVLLNRRSR